MSERGRPPGPACARTASTSASYSSVWQADGVTVPWAGIDRIDGSAQTTPASRAGRGSINKLLGALLRHRGRLLRHQALLRQVSGRAYVHDTRRIHIANLRRTIEPAERPGLVRWRRCPGDER
jgi:hypothetical protein